MEHLSAARGNLINGLVALAIVGAIALGCTCNRELNFNASNTGDEPRPANNRGTAPASPAASPDGRNGDAPPVRSTGAVPSDPEMQTLVRTTILDFNDAIQSDDFSHFHGTTAKAFQKEASPERMRDAFRDFVSAGVDFKEVALLDADFIPEPSVQSSTGGKVLSAIGSYPTTPRRTKFDLKYIQENGEWKLIAIEINTKD